MQEDFSAAYKQLNKEQRQAVDTLDGPLLVIAGPGTGKTQLLSTRVANILKLTDTKASNILCLTYTNKAAVNMKERIISLTGNTAVRLPVKTFHSFAGEIMNLYPDNFWNAARLSVAPDSVQIEIIESILSALPLDNPLALKFSGQYTLTSEIRRSIGLAKDAGLSPSKLKALVTYNKAFIEKIEPNITQVLDQRLSIKLLDKLESEIQKLPDQSIDEFLFPLSSLTTILKSSLSDAISRDREIGKTTNTSNWKKKWFQVEGNRKGMLAERRRNDWWLELTNVYEIYNDQMQSRNYYDYADMIIAVNTQLEAQDDIRADIQERFNYVLIDEFQDTTPAQLRLAHLVADHHTQSGSPNLMGVGDDDQAIYKFSGADINNMRQFTRHYPSAKIIVLKKNYRSSQAILDSAKRVIEQADNRLVDYDATLTKDLIAEKPPIKAGIITAKSYASRELQHSSVAQQIAQSFDPKKNIAVLARNHDSLIKMAGLLEQYDVPVRYEFLHNILELDIIRHIYKLAQLVLAIQEGDKNSVNALIHQIIRHPMWQLTPTVLWQLAHDTIETKDWYDSLLNTADDQLQAIGTWIGWLATEAERQPLAVLLEYMIGLRHTKNFTSPIKNFYFDNNQGHITEYFQSLSAIQLLRSLVHDFGGTETPSLSDLTRFIDIHEVNNLIVPDESPFITGSHAVQLLTVHKAKGLEFDDVYIIDAVEDNWQPRIGNRIPPANLPLQPAGEDMNDYIRLMYVALTRAKANLHLSSYYLDHVGKAVSTSSIILGAFEIERIHETSEEKLIDVLEKNLHWPAMDQGDERAILASKLDNYSLSVTHLMNFINVEKGGPEYFKERNLLLLPETKSPNLSYGTAMHSAMEIAQKLMNLDSFALPAVEQAFAEALDKEQLATNEHGRYLRQGKQLLQTVFHEYQYGLSKGSLPEQDIKDVRIGSARIRGKLDRIDFFDTSLAIIDYKTGKPLPSFATTNKAIVSKAYNHKMQLIYYTILAQSYPKYESRQSIIGHMVYLEADSPKQLIRSYTATQEDIVQLTRLIQIIYRHITTLDFPDVSIYPANFDGTLAFVNDLLKEEL